MSPIPLPGTSRDGPRPGKYCSGWTARSAWPVSGQSRPAWKVLRVLGNLTDAPGFEYLSTEEVRDELQVDLGEIEPASYSAKTKPGKLNGEDAPEAEIDTPIYSVDSLVRRAAALQMTVAAKRAAGEAD